MVPSYVFQGRHDLFSGHFLRNEMRKKLIFLFCGWSLDVQRLADVWYSDRLKVISTASVPLKNGKFVKFWSFQSISFLGAKHIFPGAKPLPMGSMGLESLSIFYIWLRFLDVDKYTSPMDPLGIECIECRDRCVYIYIYTMYTYLHVCI